MSIVTISRPSCSRGKIIAEKVAQAMGYECLSREVLLEASEQFNVPEITLAKAIHDGPTGYDHFSHAKESCAAFVKSALLSHLKKDNIVYHGLAGHFFVQGVPHILKVRLVADMESRIAEEMERENLTEEMARKRLEKDDRERCNWSSYIYKADTRDCELYDLVINLRHVSVADCVTLICNTLALDYFQETREAKARLEELALSATVKAAIVDRYHTAEVEFQEGGLVIRLPEPVPHVEKAKGEIQALTKEIQGADTVYFDIKSNTLTRTAMHK